jgi:hypothetical protein
MAEIKHAIDEERDAARGNSYLALFQNGPQKFFYRTMLGIGGQFMQQLSGINLITYYAPVIFQQSVGLSHNLSLLLAGFNGVAYFLSSLIPIWIIDRLGRRKLMLFAAGGQCVCMAILAGTVQNGGSAAGIVATVMLFMFNFFFAIGLLAIPWLRTFPRSPAVKNIWLTRAQFPPNTRLSRSDPKQQLWQLPQIGYLLSWLSRLLPLVSGTSDGAPTFTSEVSLLMISTIHASS